LGRHSKFTKEQLIAALNKAGGDLTKAAVELGVSPSTVYRAMGRHGIGLETQRRVVAA